MSAGENPKTWAQELAEWQNAWQPVWDDRSGVKVEDLAEETKSEESSGQPKPESYVGNYNADRTNPDP